MGFCCYSPLIKPFNCLIFFSNLMWPCHTDTRTRTNFEDDDLEFRHELVLLPDYLTTKSVDKDRLPVVEHATFRSWDEDEDDIDCAVCLSRIEAWHNVRELGNCGHAFHVECLDSWIDRGGETCPVCRARLVSWEVVGHGKDPWRSERMVYLFGEDCFMEELQ
ncbi:E3 ubiquitin-protein ligase RHA2B-like [Salvia divinorum]|uniref:E3 ubiquitin-protein ligase RHA2B-like n=1 Tax=Salvia divinorum TaxID=28513 RepID=A0ABD1HR59_SALDI